MKHKIHFTRTHLKSSQYGSRGYLMELVVPSVGSLRSQKCLLPFWLLICRRSAVKRESLLEIPRGYYEACPREGGDQDSRFALVYYFFGPRDIHIAYFRDGF